ncbi:glycosyltransferase [bacterium]|nr:glycosyltransferase [bacterium]
MALDQYAPIVGESVIDELRLIARKLGGRVVRNVNSTAIGGGVAEILNRMVPLLRELGIDARWDVIKGGERFYAVTKKIHNALHGAAQDFTAEDRDVFLDTQKTNAAAMDLGADVMFIHDPQPAGLIHFRKKNGGRWIWRCHIDLSAPQSDVWEFLKPTVEKYDVSVFSAPAFSQSLPIPQVLISPSIDPLSDKNRDLEESEVSAICDRLDIPRDKPLVTQVSRFDYLKDPVGVIEAFKMVKDHVDARLLLVGGSADDDPEGAKVLAEVRERAAGDPDIQVLCLPPTCNIEINAIQRASDIILQKSIKEGFGLTVSEALWKAKPVIAGAVGGIPLQIAHKYSGILTRSVEGTAYWLKQLLQSPDFARKLGENGREHVRENFLLTRHLRDYLLMFLSLDHPGKDLIYLQ